MSGMQAGTQVPEVGAHPITCVVVRHCRPVQHLDGCLEAEPAHISGDFPAALLLMLMRSQQ